MKKYLKSWKKLNSIFLFLILLSGCGYRFAIITKRECNHPEAYRTEWGQWGLGLFLIYEPRLNPLHWHKGVHHKCERCGQKFCDYYVREKWINKIEEK